MAKQNKGRKFFAASATAALVASAIVPVASAAQVNDYNKISGYAKEAVQSLVDAGVIQGDTNGNFNPLNTVTRAQAAEIFTKALELEADGDVNFSDVKKGAWYYNSIAAVVANGIFEGVSANEFAPNKSLTRSEAAKVLVDAFGLEGSESLSQFADASQVKPWAKDALETAVANGIFTGSEENGKLNLKPNAAITRQDFAVVFARTLDLAVETVDASVKAINNTTVEVTFDEEVDTDNVKAENFTIEGLKVTNAAVKQTNKKVVVLTTEAQTADKEYVLSYKDEEIGKFKGVAAVIPTAVKLTTSSVQGVIGKEVTLKAQVTVAEGQSKANIPVTFNIVNDQNTNNKIEVEALTDENGVATYSYTRYYSSVDSVTAYATSKSSVYSNAKVYWANELQLSIKDVTGVNSVANNDKKVYEINSTKNANKYVFVTYKENLGVTADKVVRTVFAEGVSTFLLNANNTITGTLSDYPYEITTGSKAVIAVKLDNNGKANLVLKGANAAVTPVVYEGVVGSDSNDVGTIVGDHTSEFTNASYNATALQAEAPTVKFEAKHTLGLTIEAQGVANAATYKGTKETGGRDYVVTYVDKDGKPAADKTKVQVAIPVQQASNGVFLVDEDGKKVSGVVSGEYRIFDIAVKGTEGKAKFTVSSEAVTQYVEPIAWVDNGTGIGAKAGLDATDLQAKGAATHFTEAVEYKSSLKLVDSADKEIKSVYANGTDAAYFLYETVDQNGKPRAYRTVDGTTAPTNVTYSVTAGVSPVFAKGTTVTQGNPSTFNETVAAGSTSTKLAVTATNATTATASATSSVAGLVLGTTNSVTATFTNTSSANVEGTVTAVDKTNAIVTINGVPYSLTGATYLNNGGVVPTLGAFYNHLTVGKAVTVTKDADGKLVFNVTGTASTDQNLFAAFQDNAAGLLSDAEFKNLLKSVNGFNGLTNASQNLALTAIKGSTATTAAALATDIETAIYNEYVTELTTLAAAAGTTYADITTLVAKIPGASAAATALKAVTNTDIQNAIITDLQTISATKAADLVTEINQAITTAQQTVAQAPSQAAVTAVTGAANVTAFEAALKANNTVDTTKTNAQILGINLSTVSSADMTDVLTSLFAKKSSLNALNAATLFADAVKLETTVPAIKTAVYNATAEELTITFSKEVVEATGTLAEADLTLVGAGGATVALNGAVATLNTTTGVTTLVISIASDSGISTASSITLNKLATTGGAASITLQDTANTPHAFVLGNFNFTVAQ